MNTQSAQSLKNELQLIKTSLLDAFLKIRLTKTKSGHTISLTEYNQKAQSLLDIKDDANFDILGALITKIPSEKDWLKLFISVIQDKKVLNFEIESPYINIKYQLNFWKILLR